MPALYRRFLATASLVLTLGACGGSDTFTTATPPPPPVSPLPPIADVAREFPQLSFNAPVAMMQAPADVTRWFVIEQQGVVRVFNNDSTVASSSVFIDISMRVNASFSESGLLGMAFHPNFPANPQVFLSYTSAGSPLTSNIARFVTLDSGATLDPTSEISIMTIAQDASNHNGGNIAFGPDGNLYAGWGDGGGSGDPLNRAQDSGNLLGTITRINIDGALPYSVPLDNPFAGAPNCQGGFAVGNANCPEIYALGLRNPWRWSFDSATGSLWAGDVGQGSWEEIDLITRSMNYGWREREGAHCFNPPSGCSENFVDPITEYGRSEGNSVTGGYVYRGADIAALQGRYVYGDFGSGRIWSIPANSPQGSVGELLLASGLSISSFAEDSDGELYLLDYGAGEIYQIVDVP